MSLTICLALATPGFTAVPSIFARDNLIAWCIVPFDAKKRGPEERVAMLKKLGFKRYAYDWRAEHLPTFDRELDLLKQNGIHLDAVWFPASLDKDARTILDLLKKHEIKTQLWITMGDPTPGKGNQKAKVEAAARILKPIVVEAGKIGCRVGLYNHGGWFGEPENQLALIQELRAANVGIVYNLHHGHDHIDRLPALLKKTLPHLYAVNLNGMVRGGDREGKKILPLGAGDLDLSLLRAIRESGYKGPIGILGHTQDDAEARLSDNLDGLDWLLPQLEGKPPGPRPKYRTYTAASQPPAKSATLGPAPPPGNHLTPALPGLRTVLIDRSPNDAYLAVKADSTGRLFVGGRDAVFVFEPDGKGGFKPRRQLCYFHQDAIIIGLEIRGNDLYVLTSNALYLLPEARVKREGIKPKRLLWGLPWDPHVSFHCLAWGPEGDLYLNHGDPLLNYGDWNTPDHWGHWTLYPRPEGIRVPYTGVGAVLRLKPDGSDLRVVATGFRGPVGLAFDRNWNLFSNDNDHESRADLYAPARLLHVTPHADFAWPRGWIASRSPDRADLLEPMNAALGRGVPCDLAYYDDPYLPELNQQLLMCRWDRMGVMRYPLRPRGASFEAEELPLLQGDSNARPVGVTVGGDGRLFVTALYLAGNVVSPYCYSDLVLVTRSGEGERQTSHPYDVVALTEDQLWTELSSTSLERRARAHTEILRRGGKTLDQATARLATAKEQDPAILHLPWLAAASGSNEAFGILTRLARESGSTVRLQALRALAESARPKAPASLFAAALASENPQIQPAGLVYFFDSNAALPVERVARLACSQDSYLRQTASMLLARRAAMTDLAGMARSSAEPVRLAAMLAAGIRLTVPSAHDVPPTNLPLFYPAESAFFRSRLQFADRDGTVDLRDMARVGSYTTAERWKKIGPTVEERLLFDLLMKGLEDSSAPVQQQAAYYLSLLHDARSEPAIARTRLALREKELAAKPVRRVDKAWVMGPITDQPGKPANTRLPEQGPIDLDSAISTPAGPRTWHAIASSNGTLVSRPSSTNPNPSWYYVYFRLQSGVRQPALMDLWGGGVVRAWHNGKEIPGTRADATALALDLQPGSNDLLLRVPAASEGLNLSISYRSREPVEMLLPEKTRPLAIASGPEHIDSVFLNVDWSKEVRKGNIEQGRSLFGKLGCVKCHAISPDQIASGAPSLTEANRRFTIPYLVESILLPSRQVAEPFRASILTTVKGKLLTGLVIQETADSVELLQSDTTRRTVPKKDIEARKPSAQSPMPAGLVKTPEELRDLLAYILSSHPIPP